MVQQINGRLAFVYAARRRQSKRFNLKLSLIGILLGIFLLPNSAYMSEITPARIIDLTNQQRQDAGLNTLTANQLLTEAAILKGQAIFKAQTFSHTIGDRRFSTWVRDTGYNYSYVGENLAIDFVTSEGVLEAWDNSPLHKKNLLSPYYREIGVGALSGKFQGQETTVIVQIFGAPAVATAQALPPSSFNNFNVNSNLNFPELSLADPQYYSAENLLTHAVSSQTSFPADLKLNLPAPATTFKANKFVVQFESALALNGLAIIFTGFLSFYLMIFLQIYCFKKINKIISL